MKGLVLSGGKSTRMGRDKGLLSYYGIPQCLYCGTQLMPWCDGVYLSIRKDQESVYKNLIGNFDVPMEMIIDKEGAGPMAGLGAAFSLWSASAWFVLAVDMPPIQAEVHITRLMAERRKDKQATVYVNDAGYFEPLCAIYEPSALPGITQALSRRQYSLQKFLRSAAVHKVPLPDPQGLVNINNQEEYQKFKDSQQESSHA